MASIFDLPSAWRGDLLPASFRGAQFHTEVGSKENGRRIVTHEFPKKEYPYSEDMGRKAIAFSVRGYCIQYPRDGPSPLYQRDYRVARDLLLVELEKEGVGVLQLPLLPPMRVVCPSYRLTEEQRLGGYCTFDMQFVEQGSPPFQTAIAPRATLIDKSSALTARAVVVMNGGR